MLEAKSVSHIGNVRGRNEDSLVGNDEQGLWVVADGVGGNTCGDVASALATQTIDRKVRQGESLTSAIVAANEAILSAANENADFRSMATTVVACRFHQSQFELAWIGDSRGYLIDGAGIAQISIDHNVAQELYQHGEIDKSQIAHHPGQHELTQALGLSSLDEVPITVGDIHDGDYVLLCTDGLSGVIYESEIYKVVRGSESISDAVDTLLNMVLEAGAPDNVTFTLIRYQDDQENASGQASQIHGYRAPFDQKPYRIHRQYRPWLLGIILVSIAVLLFWI